MILGADNRAVIASGRLASDAIILVRFLFGFADEDSGENLNRKAKYMSDKIRKVSY